MAANGRTTGKPAGNGRSGKDAAAGTAVSGAPTGARPGMPAGVTPGGVTGTPASLGQAFGEMVWLLSQSPLHKQLKLADLEWLIMPPILLGQARLFKAGTQAVGLALWAYLTPDEAAAMAKAGRLPPDGWRHGTDILEIIKADKAGKAVDLTPPEVRDGTLELWLVDLVCPFATEQNKLAEACLADLMTGALKGWKLRMHKTDQKTGERTVVEAGGV